MSVLRVGHGGAVTEYSSAESIGFGRSRVHPDDPLGWGFPGRFIELGASDEIHRVWGCFIPADGGWRVQALGSMHPVLVVRPGAALVRLEPFTALRSERGLGPDEEFIPAGSFSVLLEVGAKRSVLECEVRGESASPPMPQVGSTTVSLADRLAAEITELEYRVLWAMTRDVREGTGGAPLTHLRVQRLLGLDTRRQVIGASERLVRRFRDARVIGPEVPADQQRVVLCDRAIELGVLDRLQRRYEPANGAQRSQLTVEPD